MKHNKLNVICRQKESLGLILKRNIRKTAAHKQEIHNTWEQSWSWLVVYVLNRAHLIKMYIFLDLYLQLQTWIKSK